MKFKNYVTEMAHLSGILSSNSYSLKDDFEHYMSLKETTLFKDRIGSNHYKLYIWNNISSLIYFLVKDNQYMGQITFNKDKDTLKILTSHKEKSVKGFYNMMFSIILNDSKIKEILSDDNLSSQAVKSYKKLTKSSVLNVKIKTLLGYEPFNIDLLGSTFFNRVSISAKHKILESYYFKIENETCYKNMFNNNDTTLDQILFGENYKEI